MVKNQNHPKTISKNELFNQFKNELLNEELFKWDITSIPKGFDNKLKRYFKNNNNIYFSKLDLNDDEEMYFFTVKKDRSSKLTLIHSKNPQKSNFRVYKGELLIILTINNVKKIKDEFKLRYKDKQLNHFYLSLGKLNSKNLSRNIKFLITKFGDCFSNHLLENYEFQELNFNENRSFRDIIKDFMMDDIYSTLESFCDDNGHVPLKISETGVYYMFDYLPVWRGYDFKREFIILRNELLDYKNKYRASIELFTDYLMKAIVDMIKEMPNDVKEVGLISIPSSKVVNDNTIKKSIDDIVIWYKDGIVETEYGCDKIFSNYKNLLKRKYDVNSVRDDGPHPSVKGQIDSISFNEIYLINEDVVFIILDDITTTGDIMEACKIILINNGIKSENIYRLALARTIRNKDISRLRE